MSLGTEVFLAVTMLVTLRMLSFFPGNPDWEPCPSKIWKVKLIDGSRGKDGLMRRKVNGRWQYRRMTEKEATQRTADIAR